MAFSFRRIDALQANAGAGAVESVAIDDTRHDAAERPFRNGLLGLQPRKADKPAENHSQYNGRQD